MVTSPLLALLLKSVHTQRHGESCFDSRQRNEADIRFRKFGDKRCRFYDRASGEQYYKSICSLDRESVR
jgi:hypothetical protein